MAHPEEEEFRPDEQDGGGESEFESSDEDSGDPNVFKIRGSLEPFSAAALTIAELHEQILESQIDLSPPYQRDVVWSTQKQMAIIDSLFHNYYVPPVVFAATVDEDGFEIRICVDGKQRLTSISNFMIGNIAYRDPHTKKCWWYTVSESNRHNRSQLPKEGRELFARKELTYVEYRNLSPLAERDVFQRVQLGMSLTTAEKMQAISSPWVNWITELESKYVWGNGGLMNTINFETTRGRNFHNLAALVFCCQGLPYYRHIPSSPKITRWLSGDEKPAVEFQERVHQALELMLVLASNPNLNRAFRGKDVARKVAPVEFIFLGVLMFEMQEKEFTDDERADAAHFLRVQLRKKIKDVRLNEVVSKVCWDIIDTAIKKQSSSTSSIVRALNKSTAKGHPRGKRQVREDDEEFRPSGSASSHISALAKRLRAGPSRTR